MPTLDLIARFIGVDAGAGREFESISAKAERSSFAWAKYAAGAAVAAGTVGAVSIEMADKFEEAHTRLEGAVKNVGGNFDELGGQIGSLDSRMEKLGFTNTDVQSGLAGLVTATKSPAKAIHDMALAADLARGRNMSLADATTTLVKVETGHVALLGRLGINTKNAAGQTITQEQALQRLTDLYGGDASRYADTFGGKVDVLRARAEDLGVKIGLVLVPALVDLIDVIDGGAHAVEDVARFFKNNEVAAAALAAVLGGTLLPYMTRIVTMNLGAVFLTAKGAMAGMTAEGAGASGMFKGLLGAINPVTAALTAAAVVSYEFWHHSQEDAAKGKAAADAYVQSLNDMHTSLAASTSDSGKIWSQLTAGIRNLGSGNLDKQTAYIAELGKQYGQSSQAVAAMRTNEASLERQYGLSQGALESLAKANHINLADTQNAGQAVMDALTPTQRLTHDNRVLKTAVTGSANAVSALTEKLDTLIGGPLAEHQAAVTFADDLRKLGAAAKGNTGKINDNTRAGEANAKSLQTLAGDVQNSIQTWVKNGKSQEFVRTHALALERQLRNTADATTGNKAAVDRYLSSLNLTPAQINKVLGALHGLGAGMDAAKHKAGSDGQATGGDYVDGVLLGLHNRAGALEAAAAALGNRLNTAFRSHEGISAQSPSKKGHQSGQDYVHGVVSGVTSGSHAVALSAVQLAHLLTKGFADGWRGESGKLKDALSTPIQNALDHMTTLIDAAISKQRDALKTARATFKSDLQQRKADIASLKGTLAGGADLSNLFGTDAAGNETVANVGTYLGSQVGPLATFAKDLKWASAHHLAPGLLSQIAQLGAVQGDQVLKQFMSGQASIAVANQDDALIRRYAGSAATTVETKQYAHTLARDSHQVEKQTRVLERIERHMGRIERHAAHGIARQNFTFTTNRKIHHLSDAEGKAILKVLHRLEKQGIK